jgi:DsbC/DsbD-like thiol-disulfide interchange protein
MKYKFRLATTATLMCLLLSRSGQTADATYEVAKGEAAATVGKETKASVTILAKQGWHLNTEAPLTLKLTAQGGVELDKLRLNRSDLAVSTESEARFDVGFIATEPGRKTIEAEAGFVLCQESSCRPVREKLTITVTASLPQATPAKSPHRKNTP